MHSFLPEMLVAMEIGFRMGTETKLRSKRFSRPVLSLTPGINLPFCRTSGANSCAKIMGAVGALACPLVAIPFAGLFRTGIALQRRRSLGAAAIGDVGKTK